MYASQEGHIEIVKELIDGGGDINIKVNKNRRNEKNQF